MLFTMNAAFVGGAGAASHIRDLRSAATGEEQQAGGLGWRESKTSTPKTLPRA